MNIPGIKLVRTVWIFREKIENLSLNAHVLHITSNLVNSPPCQSEDGSTFVFCSLDLLFCGVLAAVVVVLV